MKIFEFETVDSLPALYHPEIDAVVMSDLHLGLEGSATYEGNYVPQFQLDEIKEDVRSLKKETDASKIILNGDIKHEFRFTRFSEKTEIKEFVSLLKTLFNQIKVIRGNHDNYLEEALDGVDLKEKHLEEHVLFTHGHESLNTEQYETLVIGHEHPALKLEDEIGTTEKVDCFLYGRMRNGEKIIVLPSFSKMAGGSAVNQVPQSELLSPVLRNQVDVSSLRAVAVDKEAGLFEFPEISRI